MSSSLGRKKRHIEARLHDDVEYSRVSTGFERRRLPHQALPEADLEAVDLSTEFLGKRA